MNQPSRLTRFVSAIPQSLVYLFFFFVPLQTIYIFLSPTIGNPPGVWQYGVIGLYGTDILSLLVVLCAIIVKVNTHTFVNTTPPYSRSAFQWMVFGWFIVLAWSAISVTWAPSYWVALYGVARLLELGLLVWALRQISWSWVGVCVSLVSMGCIQGMLAWQQFLNQRIDANPWLGLAYHSSRELGDSVVESVLRRFLRAYGLFAHPNMLGIYFAITIVACIALVWYVQRKWQGYMLLTAWIILISGLILTFSRAAWIATLLASITLFVVMYVLKKKVRIVYDHHPGFGLMMLAGAIIVVGVSGYGLWEPISTRLGIGGVTRLEAKSINERKSSIQEGIQESKLALPKGVGIGQYTYTLYIDDNNNHHEKPWYEYQPAHAVPLLIVSELGFAGMGGMLFLIIGLLWFLISRLRSISHNLDAVHIASLCALVVILTTAIVSDHFLWTTHAGTLLVVLMVGLLMSVADIPTSTVSTNASLEENTISQES